MQSNSHWTFDGISTAGGYIEPSSLAEFCARRIAATITLSQTPYPSPKATLTTYIEHIVCEAGCALSVTTTALALLSRYARVLTTFGDTDAYSTPDACALFLAAYMAAARMIHDAQPYTTFWARVADGAYTSEDLALMERQFIEVVEWESDASSASKRIDWESELDDVGWAEAGAEGMWMMSEAPKLHGGTGFIEEIPMLDDEDEEVFAQALYTPKPMQAAWNRGTRQKIHGRSFRRSSRMFNES